MSDVSVEVSGPFNKISGATITYAVNSIPVAMLNLDPVEAKTFLCNPDQKRRTPVKIRVKTPRGCLKFDGLLDGVSVTQGVGSMSYQAVIKSNFQNLAEVFPKFPGISPLGANPFGRVPQLKCDATSGKISVTSLLWTGLPGGKSYKCGPDVNIVQFYKAAMEAWLANQSIDTLTQIYGKVTDLSPIITLLTDSKSGYTAKLAKAVTLMESVDIAAVNGCPISTSDMSVVNSMLTNMVNQNDSAFAWDMIVDTFNSIGLCLIPGNTKLWVAPYHGLVLKPATTPGFQQSAHEQVNVAYPADYATYVLNDNGYVDIDYCAPFMSATAIDAMSMAVPSVHVSIKDIDSSLSASGGVYLANLPEWLVPSVMNSSFVGNTDLKDVAKGKSMVSAFAKPGTFKDIWAKGVGIGAKPAKERYDKQADIITNWAQIQLLTKKLGDRTGNIMANFSPHWCPGTSGSLYTRMPGIFLRFFVSSVTHSINVSAPSSGSATTVVNFSYGRLGNKLKVDEDKVFGYNAGKMEALQKAFVSDISR